eukprot:Gb_39298 [translate_table: standard]
MATTLVLPLFYQKKKRILFFVEAVLQLYATKTVIMSSSLQGEQLHGIVFYSSPVLRMKSDIQKSCKQGRLKEVLNILNGMEYGGILIDSFTYAYSLQACVNKKALPEGKALHAFMIQTGFRPCIFLNTKLVIMYANCGSPVDARQILDKMPERNVVSWNAMIAAYSRRGHGEEALRLLHQMQRAGIQPDQFTFASVLPACGSLAALEHGREVHNDIIRNGFESDIVVANTLIDMYDKCGSIESAHHVFDRMPRRNVVSWTAMIAAYASHGYGKEALSLFSQMETARTQPNHFTFASILPACADMAALEHGKEIHENIICSGFQSDVFVGSALVDMYIKCGSIDEASKVFNKMPERNAFSWTAMVAGYSQNGQVDDAFKLFHKMPERDAVSWTAMIAGYAYNGHFNEALMVFQQMLVTCVKPNPVTFVSVLPACANLAALEHGKEVHKDLIRNGFQFDILLGNALVDMYAKCGSIEDARKVFDEMHERVVVTWNSMIVGYAMHGFGEEALQVFQQMQYSGMKPNHVTFVGLLSACCHAGLVDVGCQYFDRMDQDYQITPAMEHYGCMVDLLGRAGCLNEAHDFINKMPLKPNAVVWGSLLGACRIHINIELGQQVAEHLLELEPENAAHYVLLSNIYAASGRWDGVVKVRKMMKNKNVRKVPGYSWIELERLAGETKETWYVLDTNVVLHDVEDQQKEHFLCHHSEKMAIAFQLISMFSGIPVQTVKNLLVCSDCHSPTKFISKNFG